jgi:hypothetical protein
MAFLWSEKFSPGKQRSSPSRCQGCFGTPSPSAKSGTLPAQTNPEAGWGLAYRRGGRTTAGARRIRTASPSLVMLSLVQFELARARRHAGNDRHFLGQPLVHRDPKLPFAAKRAQRCAGPLRAAWSWLKQTTVCHERTDERRCDAVQEMRVGPSEPAVRSRLQTTASCDGQEPWW